MNIVRLYKGGEGGGAGSFAQGIKKELRSQSGTKTSQVNKKKGIKHWSVEKGWGLIVVKGGKGKMESPKPQTSGMWGKKREPGG